MARCFPHYLPAEVALHNKPDDCWIVFQRGVYDLTEYVTRNPDSAIAKHLVAHGGKDVSHWFQPRERQCCCEPKLRRYVVPKTGQLEILLPYCTPKPETAHSAFCPISKAGYCPCTCAKMPECDDPQKQHPEAGLTGKCWSELEYMLNGVQYQRGWLTKKPRPCWITNVLTGQRAIISVCEEDSIERIQERALIFNRHAGSYTCKFEGKPLDRSLSLAENGIRDEADRYLAAGLPDDYTTYVPNLLFYYNDDLTVM